MPIQFDINCLWKKKKAKAIKQALQCKCVIHKPFELTVSLQKK